MWTKKLHSQSSCSSHAHAHTKKNLQRIEEIGGGYLKGKKKKDINFQH